jgi:hypothetical protein
MSRILSPYFAVEDNTEADGQVFALQALTKASESVSAASPFALNLPSNTTQTLLLHVFGRKKVFSLRAQPLNFRWTRRSAATGALNVYGLPSRVRRICATNCFESACMHLPCFLTLMASPLGFDGNTPSLRRSNRTRWACLRLVAD